jgi:uncharacterized protein YbjT (DUF2867 family)
LLMILITGATGNVGREVVNLLLAEGQKVVAISRNPNRAILPPDALVIEGNPSQPQTVSAALGEIEAVLLSPRPVDGGATDLLRLTRSKGARRVVVLSALTVQYGGGYRRFADEFRAIEDAAKQSGLDWTVLRSADYASNAKAWLPQIRRGDVVRGAYGDAATSTVHEWDVAAVAARALVDAAHAGQTYMLTGPQSITQREKVRVIGHAINRNVTWQEVPPEQVRQAMLAQGVSPDVPDRMLGYLSECVEKPGPSSDSVQRLLQRPALTFAEWATEHAAEFRTD